MFIFKLRTPTPLLAILAIILAAAVTGACGGSGDDVATGDVTPTASVATLAPTTTTGPILANEGCPPADAAASLIGGGTTFPAPLYEGWFTQYKDLCNVEISYQPVGSGPGITQLTTKASDFGSSDTIMSATQKAATAPVHHIPMTSEAVAVVYNIDGVESGVLTLDGSTLAGIFLGTITKWNDPAIAALNSGVALPAQDIAVVHRSDAIGTTSIFTTYLSKASTDWQIQVGSASTVRWPVGTDAEGNAGLAAKLEELSNSIGYVTLSYATQNALAYAKIKNRSGTVVEPSIESARAAQVGVELPDDMEVLLEDSPNPAAYPITGFSWLLVYAEQTDAAKAKTLGHLIKWMLTEGQQGAAELNYVPLSEAAAAKALAELDVTTFEGTPVLDLN